MPEKTPHDYIVDFFAQLTDEVSKVSLHTGKPTSQRMQELEQQLAFEKRSVELLTEDRDRLAREMAVRSTWSIHNHQRLVTQVRRIVGDQGIPPDATPPQLIGALQRTVEPAHFKAIADERDSIIATLRTHLAAGSEENARLRQEHNTLQKIHHEWVNGQRTKEPTLSESIQRINDVVTMQIEALSPTSGTGKVVDIRRRMLAKYSIQHDLAHLEDRDLIGAATALLTGNLRTWPWSADTYNNIIADNTQLPTAAALIIAHYDALREAGQES